MRHGRRGPRYGHGKDDERNEYKSHEGAYCNANGPNGITGHDIGSVGRILDTLSNHLRSVMRVFTKRIVQAHAKRITTH